MKNGEMVARFEGAFAEYVGAKYAIALCNGTATLHTALVALGVIPGDRVAVPPLTMSATTIAVLHAGAIPVFVDVDPETWVMGDSTGGAFPLWVSLYGLGVEYQSDGIDDAAQTLRKHSPSKSFTSYSFQASKILPLGEGGMLVTNDERLATRAREFSSLGYRMRADQPRIDPAVLKSPTFERHHSLGWNYRMNDLTAARGLNYWDCSQSFGGQLDELRAGRRAAASYYVDAIAGCDWLRPQKVPEGWRHDYWAYAVRVELWAPSYGIGLDWEYFADRIERYGGERPYAAWRLTYHEPAFRHLNAVAVGDLTRSSECPVAEDLQPRLMQFQTNSCEAASKNADALYKAIKEIGG